MQNRGIPKMQHGKLYVKLVQNLIFRLLQYMGIN